MNLEVYGWNDFFEAEFAEYSGQGFIPARVLLENRNNYKLYSVQGVLNAEVSGKFHHNNKGHGDFPVVGDWVTVKVLEGQNRAIIHNFLPRKSKFSRKTAGSTTTEQVIAANIDVVFLMTSLNADFNMRRLERYLTLAWESDAKPVVILSKADLCANVDEIISDVNDIAFGAPVHAVSSLRNEGIDELKGYFAGNKTAAILGSSGVGKSTLINTLAGEEMMKTQETINYKDKGRHTTTNRQLIVLPGGGLIIDTPGMRELQLWDGSEGLQNSFKDIEDLAAQCKFSDCRHSTEPGCAVIEAIENGTLDEGRYESYKKLLREISYFERRQNQKEKLQEKRKWKQITKNAREGYKIKGKN